MADESNDRFDDAEASEALSEVRQALEAVERRQGSAARERRRLRAQLDGLLKALREDAVVLYFDAEGDLVEAKGPLQEQLGASAAELLADFEDFADEETVDALEEANKAVLEDEATGACVSDGFLHGDDEDLAVTFIHLRRTDEDGELLGTEAIGLVAPAAEPDEDLDAGTDPFQMLLDHIGHRLIDDAGEASVERAVQTFGDFLLADRVVINRYDEEGRRFAMAESWLRADTRPLVAEERGIPISEIPWAYSALGAGEHVVISEGTELPADARNEKKLYASDGVASALLVPMVRRDALVGFVSIQSAQSSRDWSDADVSRARSFVMLLAAALARAEVEAELDEAREDAEQAAARGERAEARAEEAEARAQEAEVRARDAEKLAEETGSRLETVEAEARSLRDKLDGIMGGADTTRSEMEGLMAEAERAQRRSEDAAADALAVRRELEDVRGQLADALRDAAELRAGGSAAALAFSHTELAPEPEESEESEEEDVLEMEEDVLEVDFDDVEETPAPWSPRPRRGDDFDFGSTIETKSEDFGRSFDPDATLELEAAREAADRAAEEIGGDNVEQPADTEEEDKDLPRAIGLDAILGRTLTSAEKVEEAPERWKEEKASWEDRAGEVDLPEFLTDRDDDDDDVVEIDIDDENDFDAARRMAREAAGRDEADDHDRDRDRGLPPVILPDFMERTGEFSAARPGRVAAEPEVEEEPEPETLPPLAGIDTEVGLGDVGGNVELYRNLLTKFRRDYIGASSKIKAAIDKGNIEVAHLLLHAVKGVSGVLGALRVRDTADDLETKLIGSDAEATRASMEAFGGALNQVLDAIGELEGNGGGASNPVHAAEQEQRFSDDASEAHVSDPMVLRSYLSGLRQHLMAERSRQCQLVMREITARNWPGDYNARVGELATLLDEADFEAARESFEALMATFVES